MVIPSARLSETIVQGAQLLSSASNLAGREVGGKSVGSGWKVSGKLASPRYIDLVEYLSNSLLNYMLDDSCSSNVYKDASLVPGSPQFDTDHLITSFRP
jgi:hypothetical protein